MCKNCFNSKNLNIDLSAVVDNLIQECLNTKTNYTIGFSNDIIKCSNCSYEDIDNVYNFYNICCLKLCFKCFESIDKESGELLDENENIMNIYNINRHISYWICMDCETYCDGCNMSVYETDMIAFKDKKEEYDYKCCNCINNGEYDFQVRGDNDIWDRGLCLLSEEDRSKCEDFECYKCGVNVDYDEDVDIYEISDERFVCEECCEFDIHYISGC